MISELRIVGRSTSSRGRTTFDVSRKFPLLVGGRGPIPHTCTASFSCYTDSVVHVLTVVLTNSNHIAFRKILESHAIAILVLH